MTDRERILSTITGRLATTLLLGHKRGDSLYRDFDGNPYPQFESSFNVKPNRGDIVKCNTQLSEEWKFARFLEDHNGSNGGYWLLQQIGGKMRVKMHNESISVLIGIGKEALSEGYEWKTYQNARKAFYPRFNRKADSYAARCGGVYIEGENLKIWVRPHIFGQEKTVDGKKLYAHPYIIEMKWSKKTKLKDIVETMIQAGFPREYEFYETPPEKGMGGCITITKESMTKALENAGG